jgi:hypothetical protein
LYRLCAEISANGSWFRKKDDSLSVAFSAKRVKPVIVSFAEIVGTYFRGQIDRNRPIESICENHAALMGKGREKTIYDHLTHNTECNFQWAIAPITETLNKQAQERDKIKPPFYFFTVYDKTIDKYKVKLGVCGFGWERCYLFDDLMYKNPDEDIFTPRFNTGSRKDNTLYIALYERFKNKIGQENVHAETSYLSYWAKPELAYGEGNILTAMVDEPADTYTPALKGFLEDNWDDMPIV